MDAILSLITKYPHLIVHVCFLAFVVITQSYYAKKMYYSKDEKYRKQHKIVTIITAIMILIMFVVVLFALASCSEDDKQYQKKSVNRTIIVYMAADNDLYADALDDIDEMKQGFSEAGISLIVFADLPDEVPRLLEIHPDKETLIKSYPELNSANPAVLKRVVEEIIELYPAPEYGLILWLHGTSWLPALSCYIPMVGRNDLNDYYKTLNWVEDSGIYSIYNK